MARSRMPPASHSASATALASSRVRRRKASSLTSPMRASLPRFVMPSSAVSRFMRSPRLPLSTSSGEGTPAGRFPLLDTVTTQAVCTSEAVSSRASAIVKRQMRLGDGRNATWVSGSHGTAASATCVSNNARMRMRARRRTKAAAARFRSMTAAAPWSRSWSATLMAPFRSIRRTLSWRSSSACSVASFQSKAWVTFPNQAPSRFVLSTPNSPGALHNTSISEVTA
mmetsp:Transcript_85649/g.247272  ORF Transcript_85649/g.247272 Transcript_85649/m.247272 type:complete len:226 (-) Transcript_85649:1692-2369(-)